MKKEQNQLNLFGTSSIGYGLLAILIINSAYLSYRYINFYYLGGMLDSFDCADNCDSVMTSSYAMLLGIPVPVYGFVSFSSLLLLFFIVDSTKSSKETNIRNFHKLADRLLQIGLILGSLSAMSFLYILYSIMEVNCKFCLTSHVCLFLLVLFYFFIYRPKYIY